MQQLFTTRRFHFSAAHRYWNDAWTAEENQRVFGKCTNPHGHGHNYTLEVTVAGQVDDATGMVINLSDLREIVDEILQEFDHKHLNLDTPYFQEMQPTTENLSRVLWKLIAPRLPSAVRLHRIRLFESDEVFSEYFGDGSASFGRMYHFEAAHRLVSSKLSEAENQKAYGKCFRPPGHGHNYRFEVLVHAPIGDETGMAINMGDLDRSVKVLLDELDHRSLNDHPAFIGTPSTAENLTQFIWNRLQTDFGQQLDRVRLWETRNNICEISRER